MASAISRDPETGGALVASSRRRRHALLRRDALHEPAARQDWVLARTGTSSRADFRCAAQRGFARQALVPVHRFATAAAAVGPLGKALCAGAPLARRSGDRSCEK